MSNNKRPHSSDASETDVGIADADVNGQRQRKPRTSGAVCTSHLSHIWSGIIVNGQERVGKGTGRNDKYQRSRASHCQSESHSQGQSHSHYYRDSQGDSRTSRSSGQLLDRPNPKGSRSSPLTRQIGLGFQPQSQSQPLEINMGNQQEQQNHPFCRVFALLRRGQQNFELSPNSSDSEHQQIQEASRFLYMDDMGHMGSPGHDIGSIQDEEQESEPGYDFESIGSSPRAVMGSFHSDSDRRRGSTEQPGDGDAAAGPLLSDDTNDFES